MKIGWLFPHRERCGIAQYARQFFSVPALAPLLTPIDPSLFLSDKASFLKMVNSCDLVHLQYDTAAFMNHGHDYYQALVKSIRGTTVVTVHEVYAELPFVYPRSALKGNFLTKPLRRFVYDLRHPVATAYSRHLRCSFFTDTIHVHHTFHASIINNGSHRSPNTVVIPYPVPPHPDIKPPHFVIKDCLHLGAFGFINPAFDYDLLFAVLERLEYPWKFTWIGGSHPDRPSLLLRQLHDQINRRDWNDRFVITGWVDDSEIRHYLSEVNMVLAFFITRSSSGSLAAAFAAGKPVFATRIPLTEAIAASLSPTTGGAARSPLLLVDNNPSEIAQSITSFIHDTRQQHDLSVNIHDYCNAASLDRTSAQLLSLYDSLAAP